MAAAKSEMRVPHFMFSDPIANVSMRVIKAICGAVAASLLVLCPLIAQSPAEPKTHAQGGMGSAQTPGEKPHAQPVGTNQVDSEFARLPQLVDITSSTGIHFEHVSTPEQKYIMESMSGGVALIDYDRDGWPDIYFTNPQSVEMARSGKKARERPLSQQPRRHVHRCHREGWRGVSLLGNGGLRRRLQQ